jgi:hypothetical protein
VVAPPAVNNRPLAIAGDWMDNRVNAVELHQMELLLDGNRHKYKELMDSSFVVLSTPQITYGNCRTEVVAILNSKDPTPPLAIRMADRHLVNVRRTMVDTLVLIIDCIHYLLVSKFVGSILANPFIYGRQGGPGPHLETAKVQIVAPIIKSGTFGVDTLMESPFAATPCGYDLDSIDFSLYAIMFIWTRISSEQYGF